MQLLIERLQRAGFQSRMRLFYCVGCFVAIVLVLLSYHHLVDSVQLVPDIVDDGRKSVVGLEKSARQYWLDSDADASEKVNDILPRAGQPASAQDAQGQQPLIVSLEARIHQLEERIRELEKSSVGKSYPKVKHLPLKMKKRILVTGGAGFVGSHLVDRLMAEGHQVTVADNFFTGSKRNVAHWLGHPNFELLQHDVVNPLFVEVDQIYSLASPASPPHYMINPVKTIKTNTLGTINMLGLARRVGARILITSTSEVYGDPEVHPQPEDYWGHVNPIGPRSCYDEGKRVAEALAYAYAKQEAVEVRVARVFNTFGPRMHVSDGRVVSNFVLQALQGGEITIYGNGKQTRSFQYVSDLVDGLVRLMNSNISLPVNIGCPDEYSISEFAHLIKDLVTNPAARIVHREGVIDDPQRRKPDITRARKELNWEPKVSLQKGLLKTIAYFRSELAAAPKLDDEL